MPEYVALDLETTGLDPARDRVIEVGAVAFTPDGQQLHLSRELLTQPHVAWLWLIWFPPWYIFVPEEAR